MKEKILIQKVNEYFNKRKRIVAPLLGLPGLKLVNSNIKLAQQNYSEHFKVIKAIAERFRPDAIFPLMDLSIEANALGQYTIFPINESATVITNNFIYDDINRIRQIDIKADMRLLGYVKTVKLMSLTYSENMLIGAYVTGPYTLAGLLLGANNAAAFTISEPEYLLTLCEILIEKIIDYIALLLLNGAQIICVLEPSAVMLAPDQFELFSMKYVNKICDYCKNTTTSVVYHICGNSMHLIDKMCEAGVDALSLDSKEAGIDLKKVAKNIPEDIIIIGNICPTGKILNGKPQDVKSEVENLLNEMVEFPNFILSTGCDLPQEVPLENIHSFIETGKNYKLTHNTKT